MNSEPQLPKIVIRPPTASNTKKVKGQTHDEWMENHNNIILMVHQSFSHTWYKSFFEIVGMYLWMYNTGILDNMTYTILQLMQVSLRV